MQENYKKLRNIILNLSMFLKSMASLHMTDLNLATDPSTAATAVPA